MKKLLLALLPVLTIVSSCTYITGKRVRGNGNVTTQERTVSTFSGVNTSGFFDVYVVNGPSTNVKIEAEDNLIPYIETNVEGNILKIRTKEGFSLRPKRKVNVYVTAPAFSEVKLSGSGNIISQNQISNSSKIELGISGSGDIKASVNAPSVDADISGSGNIHLEGQVKDFDGHVSGSGDIRAMDLKSETTKVEINGSGNADVFASVQLNVEVRGSGDVKYKGNPQISSDIKGSGSVKKVD